MAEYKKGGLTGNSNLYATNRLFVKNPLFKKRKKKAPGVYDPTAKFRYKEGGTKDKSPAYIEKDLTREEIEKYRKGGYIVEEVNDPSIPKLDRLKPGGAPCPRGQMRDASGKCVNYNWGSGNIQAADSYAGMYGGYDRSGVKNLKQVSANAKKGKKFSDYVLRGGKSRADVARNLGKNAGQYFGMSGEAIEPVNFTKAGLDKFTADVKSAKKNSEAGEKDYQNYLKSKEKVSKGKMDSSKYAKEFDQKGWSQYDVNTKEGSGSDADYSAKDARQNWGDSDEWKKFTGLVSNAATAIPLLGAAGAAGSAGAALLENPVVQGGLTAYGAYDAATNTIPEAAKDFSEGRYWEGLGNVALAGLDVVPGIGLAGKGLKAGTKGLGKVIDKGVKTFGTNKAFSLPNKGLSNLDLNDAPNIDFQGAQTFDYGDVPEVLSGLRQRGQNLDQLGVKGSELLHPDMVNYHGTYSGRPIVEVKMPDGSSEMFYKSSGWAGKEGAGADGTTAGMWQVYGGHSKSPSADNWFIKDYGYTDYYGSNTYKEMAENLNDALGQKYGFKNTDELDNAFNFQNKQGAVNTYTPSANDPSSTAYYKSKNTGTNTSTGLTEADIAAARAEEEAWTTSDEYLKRRMKNTGESAKEVRADVAKMLKRADTASYDVNANLKGAHGAMSTNPFMNPRVSVSSTAPNPKAVLGHENIHLYSPASAKKSLFGKNLHKGWENPNVADLPSSERGVYANYPTIGDAPNSIMYPDASDYGYNMLGYEQQARQLAAMRDIAAKNNVDLNAGKKLTEKQVRSHMDDFIKTRENVDYDYDTIWSAEILNEREKLANAFGAPLDEIKKIDPDKYKEIINTSKDNAAKTITNTLNKAWVVAPTVGVAGTAAMLANPFEGSNGLQQQKKGGSTDDSIEIDIPEEEIQWYIDNGYIVEPVTKLKKFIG